MIDQKFSLTYLLLYPQEHNNDIPQGSGNNNSSGWGGDNESRVSIDRSYTVARLTP